MRIPALPLLLLAPVWRLVYRFNCLARVGEIEGQASLRVTEGALPPNINLGPAVDVNPVRGLTANLFVSAMDPDHLDSELVYSWASTPAGTTFTGQNTNGGRSDTGIICTGW